LVPRVVTVDLTHEAGIADDAICGGKMDVFIEPWPRPSKERSSRASH